MLQEAEKVASVIAAARRLLGQGKMVDLSALEGKVRALCADVEEAWPAADSPVRKALDAILADIGHLGDELVAQHQKMTAGATGETLGRALDAYRKSEGKS